MSIDLITYKQIDGFPKYLISDFGDVISFHNNKIKKLIPGLNKKKNSKSNGYYFYNLKDKNGDQKTIEVHRLVAKAFIRNTKNKEQVNHIDGNTINNHYSNLEWVTRSENLQHAVNVLKRKLGSRGSKNIHSKLNENDIENIFKLINSGYSQTSIGKIYKVKANTISNIINGVTWNHIKITIQK